MAKTGIRSLHQGFKCIVPQILLAIIYSTGVLCIEVIMGKTHGGGLIAIEAVTNPMTYCGEILQRILIQIIAYLN